MSKHAEWLRHEDEVIVPASAEAEAANERLYQFALEYSTFTAPWVAEEDRAEIERLEAVIAADRRRRDRIRRRMARRAERGGEWAGA